MRHLIYRAMHQSDDLVATFEHTDAKGVTTRRVVSSIRFLGQDRFLALCLSREEPRQFRMERCQNVRLASVLAAPPVITIMIPGEANHGDVD